MRILETTFFYDNAKISINKNSASYIKVNNRQFKQFLDLIYQFS